MPKPDENANQETKTQTPAEKTEKVKTPPKDLKPPKTPEKNEKQISEIKSEKGKTDKDKEKKNKKNKVIMKTKLERQISNIQHVMDKYTAGKVLGELIFFKIVAVSFSFCFVISPPFLSLARLSTCI